MMAALIPVAAYTVIAVTVAFCVLHVAARVYWVYQQRTWRLAADESRERQWADIEAGVVPDGEEPSMMFEAYWADPQAGRRGAIDAAAAEATGWLREER